MCIGYGKCVIVFHSNSKEPVVKDMIYLRRGINLKVVQSKLNMAPTIKKDVFLTNK